MSYGCGLSTCKECYPFTYRCEVCHADYPEPVANGAKFPDCGACGYNADAEYPEYDPQVADLVSENGDVPNYDGYVALAALAERDKAVTTVAVLMDDDESEWTV